MYVRQRIENFRLDRSISNTMVKNFDTAFFLYEQSIQTKRDKTADFLRR